MAGQFWLGRTSPGSALMAGSVCWSPSMGPRRCPASNTVVAGRAAVCCGASHGTSPSCDVVPNESTYLLCNAVALASLTGNQLSLLLSGIPRDGPVHHLRNQYPQATEAPREAAD